MNTYYVQVEFKVISVGYLTGPHSNASGKGGSEDCTC